ncbi:MAG: STAS domain-containing protein [Spirochaetes bacterium]|nr:STAS domain-containing protein [Spirochaetota bacterium]
MLKIGSQQTGDTITITIEGGLTIENVKILERDFHGQAMKKPGAIGLNCKNLTYIDSSGIGLFVKLVNTSKSLDFELVFVEPSQMVMSLFINAKLDRFFKILSESQYDKIYLA